MQVLAKIKININLFNKMTSFSLHFVNKVIWTVNRLNSKHVKQNRNSCSTFWNHTL